MSRHKTAMRLPNDQKRLRHLECVGVRHLVMPDGRLFSGYFTLHDAIDGREFYRSEVLEGTCNPTWRNVDVNAYQNSPDLGSSAVVVRVWSSPAADAGEPGATQPLQVLAWDVDLYGLQFIRKKVSVGSGCDSRGLLAPRPSVCPSNRAVRACISPSESQRLIPPSPL